MTSGDGGCCARKKQVWYFSNFNGTFIPVFAQTSHIFMLNKGPGNHEDSPGWGVRNGDRMRNPSRSRSYSGATREQTRVSDGVWRQDPPG